MRAQGAMQKVRLPQRTRNQARVTEAEDVENAVNAVVNVSSIGDTQAPAVGRERGRFREVHCDPGVVVEEELLQLRDNVQTVEEYIIGST